MKHTTRFFLATAFTLALGACDDAADTSETESPPGPAAAVPSSESASGARPRPAVPDGWSEHTQQLGGRSVVFSVPPEAQVSATDTAIDITVLFDSHTTHFFITEFEDIEEAILDVYARSGVERVVERSERGAQVVVDHVDAGRRNYTYVTIDTPTHTKCEAGFTLPPERAAAAVTAVQAFCDAVR